MLKTRRVFYIFILALFIQGCFFTPAMDDRPQTMEQTSAAYRPTPTASSTPLPSPTVVPAAGTALPTLQPVTITAVGGNLYIRRGPGMEYDRIGVLKKGSSAQVIGRDVLSRWVQVNVPGSDRTGWVSIMTDLSRIDGDLNPIPDFTFTDWPQPAYIKNCTEHDLYIMPGEIYLYNLYTNSKYLNEAQVNPGVYTVYDLFVPGEPEIETVDVREGMTVYITVNGLGVKHNCP
ncbi:MAG: hypothetical protein DPW18_18685 [Chloroflexi bacterium]|nr:hypothetical protein [Chloroflexota bacterium]MDL1940915.1 SH3 domain-containing protein [Chloroflexi bacterium CFX2]